jgi:hypothetical protein
MREESLSAAHQATGVPKATLTVWAKAGGIDLADAAARSRVATAARAAQLTDNTVTRLEQIVEAAAAGLLRRLHTNDAAGQGDADAIARYELLAQLEPTRDLVGALTRGIHDLNLLKGEATESGTINVTFGTDFPRPREPAHIVENVDVNPDGR